MLPGAVQRTSRLVVMPEVADTAGMSGASGISTALVRVIVTATVSVPLLLSSAFTRTA